MLHLLLKIKFFSFIFLSNGNIGFGSACTRNIYVFLGVKEYEPYTALNGGINGTEVLMKVVVKASQLLKVNGKLIIEIGKDQKYKMIKFLKTNNFFVKKTIKDLSGHNRCIISVKLT